MNSLFKNRFIIGLLALSFNFTSAHNTEFYTLDNMAEEVDTVFSCAPMVAYYVKGMASYFNINEDMIMIEFHEEDTYKTIYRVHDLYDIETEEYYVEGLFTVYVPKKFVLSEDDEIFNILLFEQLLEFKNALIMKKIECLFPEADHLTKQAILRRIHLNQQNN